MALLALIAAVAIVSDSPASSEFPDVVLRYPGAETVMDMNNPDGSRTLQLQTSDPLNSVESWYQNHLKLTKAVRLTSSSYVLKNDKVTITLAVEDKKTNILIKQSAK